ncbi:PspC domain-containing protein [Clostridium sp. C2-6-12]|uniref:PspC domain-containing protein n=1 Tax=Clostridium sp. C2-6-12 TaxID=2698832 RepID=UPI001371CD87|nr:PspC domain-containing protein [Clostridium sp. C2-6-12]
MLEKKRLYKDISRKKISGVLAGFSDYINGDVTLVRVLFVLITIELPILIVIYFIFAILMPDKQDIYNNPDRY